MVWYETVLFDALSFLRFIGISDSVTKFGLITYNCLCNKKSILHIKAQYCLTVGGCRISHVSVLACICVCVHVCAYVCGVSKAWQPTLYLLFIVTTELYY